MTDTAHTVPAVTVHRVMGIETEFGVSHADPQLRAAAGVNSAIALSHLTVASYALLAGEEGASRRRVRWDYGDETPLRDARGFELQRAAAHPTQLTDEVEDAHVASVDLDAPVRAPEIPADATPADVLDTALRRAIGNAVLSNGARLYVDHAHPEYSSPEVTTPREALQWDLAGDLIAQRAMELIHAADGIPDVALYKNNTDGKGASYGTHENYLLSRAVPWERVVEALLPFFASRHVITGAGRVGRGQRGEQPGLQTSSRADFFEATVGLETTLNRPIVNTRDEPHADASRYRRLHVIVGDANLLHIPTLLKTGMTSLVLAALEAEHTSGKRILPRIDLVDPVAAMRTFSHDPTLRATAPTRDGRQLTALEIQRQHLEAIAPIVDREDPDTREIIDLWSEVLDDLASDPLRAADRVEWAAKLQLLESYRARHQLAWDDARLQAIDLQFTDLRPERSLAQRLARSGAVRTVISETAARGAMTTPPPSTRAHLRGSLVAGHRERIVSAGWDVLTAQSADGGGVRLRMSDPLLGSATWCAKHGVDPAATLDEVLAALQRASST